MSRNPLPGNVPPRARAPRQLTYPELQERLKQAEDQSKELQESYDQLQNDYDKLGKEKKKLERTLSRFEGEEQQQQQQLGGGARQVTGAIPGIPSGDGNGDEPQRPYQSVPTESSQAKKFRGSNDLSIGDLQKLAALHEPTQRGIEELKDMISSRGLQPASGDATRKDNKQGASGSSWLPRNPFSSCATCTDLQKKIDQLQEEKSSLVTEMNAEMQISQGDCGESKEKIAKQYELFFTQEADNLTKHLRSNKLDGKVKLCEFFERVHGIIQQQIISIVQGAVPPLFQLSASPRKLPLKDLSRAYARLLVSQNLTLQCPPELEQQIVADEYKNHLPDLTIRKAIALSWKLATAVPPMIPLPSTQYPGFDEKIHEQTAGGSRKNIQPGGRVKYVRPVLLASCSADSVMAKGLVANT